jgi:hypothetical protein
MKNIQILLFSPEVVNPNQSVGRIGKIAKIIESVTFKMTHSAFVNKDQNQYDYTWNLNLIDKCKMCHFECHGLNSSFLATLRKNWGKISKISTNHWISVRDWDAEVSFWARELRFGHPWSSLTLTHCGLSIYKNLLMIWFKNCWFLFKYLKIFHYAGVQSINNVFHIVNKVGNALVFHYILNLIDNMEYFVYALYSTMGHTHTTGPSSLATKCLPNIALPLWCIRSFIQIRVKSLIYFRGPTRHFFQSYRPSNLLNSALYSNKK